MRQRLVNALKLYVALVESTDVVSPKMLWSWGAVKAAINHSPKSDILARLDKLSESEISNVLAYARSFDPLTSYGVVVEFKDKTVRDGAIAKLSVSAGGVDILNDTHVSAGTSLALETLLANGGIKYNNILERDFAKVDTLLPYDLLNSGVETHMVESALITALSGNFAPTGPKLAGFAGRINSFVTERQLFDTPRHLIEAMVISNKLDKAVLAKLCEVDASVADTTSAAAVQSTTPDAGGAVSTAAGHLDGNPAASASAAQDKALDPTQVPDNATGEPGVITLPDGTVVPEEVMKLAMSKLLQNLATQLATPSNATPPENTEVPTDAPVAPDAPDEVMAAPVAAESFDILSAIKTSPISEVAAKLLSVKTDKTTNVKQVEISEVKVNNNVIKSKIDLATERALTSDKLRHKVNNAYFSEVCSAVKVECAEFALSTKEIIEVISRLKKVYEALQSKVVELSLSEADRNLIEQVTSCKDPLLERVLAKTANCGKVNLIEKDLLVITDKLNNYGDTPHKLLAADLLKMLNG